MRICSQCKQAKDDSEFTKWRGKKDGLRAYCKACNSAYMSNYYQNTIGGRYHRLLYLTKAKNVEFGFTKETFKQWLETQPNRCYYCQQELTRSKGRIHLLSDVTFDRKDSTRGYTPNNVVLSCRRCNMIKGDWFTEAQMLEIAQKYFLTRPKIGMPVIAS